MPSFMSITKTAKSAKLPPLFLKFVNAACPGVSINKNPGIWSLIPVCCIKGQAFFNPSKENNVKDIF